ncbi:MAG: membrane protein insertase YidC [Deltaproteobacteria bacterium]|nr:MAG: membrane protein insertase YidC [Deltaproteobacteria bacterium]
MDRRTLTAILLTLGLYYAWIAAFGPFKGTEAVEDPALAGEETPEIAPAPEPVATASTAHLPVEDIDFAACGFEAKISTAGGGMHDVRLPKVEAPLDIQTLWGKALSFLPFYDAMPGGWNPYGDPPGPLTMAGPKGAIAAVGVGELEALPHFGVETRETGKVVLAGVTEDGVAIRHSFTAVPESDASPCYVEVETSWSGPTDKAAWIGVHAEMAPEAGYYDNEIRPYAVVDGGQDYEMNLDNVVEDRISEGPVSWFGIADRYFLTGLLPEDDSKGTLYFSQRGEGEGATWGDHYVVANSLSAGEVHAETFKLYIGDKTRANLDRLHDDLGVLQNYGWFAVFAGPLLWLLVFLQGYVGNWGLAIITLTVLVKSALFPLTHMGFKSSQRMQDIQPQLAEIKEKYAEQPEELNRRTMELFQKEGVNPFGGCLPMILQMPVWFALYRVLLQAPQLYHTDFLYLKDLSSVDPYGALPFAVVGLMLLQQQFTPMGNLDPTQARVMKLMPVIFGFFFFTFPSGLVLYIFVNTMLSILQQWWIRRSMARPAATPTPQGAAT